MVGTGYAGVRPRDYAEGGRTSLERFFKSVPLLSLARPHPTVFVLRVTDTLPHALAVRALNTFFLFFLFSLFPFSPSIEGISVATTCALTHPPPQ